MKKRFLILLVVLMSLLMISSCKKKEDSSNDGPVVTVAQDRSEERSYQQKTFDKEISTITVNEDSDVKNTTQTVESKEEETVVEEVNKDRKLSFVYRGGSVLLRSTFTSDSAEIKTNVTEDDARYFASRLLEENPDYNDIYSVSFSGDTVTLAYPATLTEDDLSSFWNKVKDLMDRINAEEAKKEESLSAVVDDTEIKATLLEEKAEIALPETINESVIDSFMASLSLSNPELASKAKYEVNDGVLSLYYTSPVDKAEAESLWNEMIREAQSFFSGKEENIEVVETEEEVEEDLPTLQLNHVEKEPLLAPLTTAGKLLDRFSVSLSMSGKLNDGFDSDIKVAFDVAVTPTIRVGVTAGYEVKGYIPLSLRARFNVSLLQGLYAYVDGGWRFGLGDNKSGVIVSLGVGYELELFDSFYMFGEGDLQMGFGENIKLMPSIAIGARYRF